MASAINAAGVPIAPPPAPKTMAAAARLAIASTDSDLPESVSDASTEAYDGVIDTALYQCAITSIHGQALPVHPDYAQFRDGKPCRTNRIHTMLVRDEAHEGQSVLFQTFSQNAKKTQFADYRILCRIEPDSSFARNYVTHGIPYIRQILSQNPTNMPTVLSDIVIAFLGSGYILRDLHDYFVAILTSYGRNEAFEDRPDDAASCVMAHFDTYCNNPPRDRDLIPICARTTLFPTQLEPLRFDDTTQSLDPWALANGADASDLDPIFTP